MYKLLFYFKLKKRKLYKKLDKVEIIDTVVDLIFDGFAGRGGGGNPSGYSFVPLPPPPKHTG